MSDGKSSVKRLLGRIFQRMEGYARDNEVQARREALDRVSMIAASSLIAPEAQVLNYQGDRDNIEVAANCDIHGDLVIFPQGGRIKIGERVFIGAGSRIWSAASISIGEHVLIAHDVNIHDNISHSVLASERREEMRRVLPAGGLFPHNFDLKAKPLVIEPDVWIGFGASIIGGLTIGRGAIVGAGAMVTKDVPSYAVVVGNPMRIVRQQPDVET